MFTNERLENLSEHSSEVKHAVEFVAGKQPPVTDYQYRSGSPADS